MDGNKVVLAVLIFSVSIVGLGMGATLPVVALRMYQAQAGTLAIGVLAAMPAAGMMLSAFCVEGLCQRLSRRGIYLAALGLCALSTVAIEPLAAWPWWLALARLAMGVGMGVVIILGEAWVNEMSPAASRGRLVALYASCFTAFQMLGPAAVAWLGAGGPAVIACVLGGYALALLGVAKGLPASRAYREQQAQAFSVLGFIRLAPALCAGVVFFSFFDSVVLSMFPVYAVGQGMAMALAALMASVILAGDAACQVPLGWLADRYGRNHLYLGCGVLVAALGAALPWLMHSGPWLWPALMLLGAAAGGTYTLAIVLIGERFDGAELVTANASAGLLWGAGSLAGPLASGALLGLGREGVPVALVAMALLFVWFAWSLCRQRRITLHI